MHNEVDNFKCNYNSMCGKEVETMHWLSIFDSLALLHTQRRKSIEFFIQRQDLPFKVTYNTGSYVACYQNCPNQKKNKLIPRWCHVIESAIYSFSGFGIMYYSCEDWELIIAGAKLHSLFPLKGFSVYMYFTPLNCVFKWVHTKKLNVNIYNRGT